MTSASNSGLCLEPTDGGAAFTTLEEINLALAPFGGRVWPLDLSAAPAEIRRLLAQPTLSESESAQVMDHFLLTRERLLEIVEAAGRTPQVPGGGQMSTYVVNYDYSYPQLYLVQAGVDYSRFDRLHINTADDGTGVDEVMMILSGAKIRFLQQAPGADLLELHLDCPDVDSGWLMTYDGALPHVGSISGASAGAKILMQVIGAPRWTMRYEDDK